jgi:hypothetical protein
MEAVDMWFAIGLEDSLIALSTPGRGLMDVTRLTRKDTE